MVKKFSNFMKSINPQIQESQQSQIIRNMRKTGRHIVLKLCKTNDINL